MPDHNESQNKTAGELLKEKRESKGLSLMTVHEGTNIPMDALRAIEEGYSVRTLSAFYLKGFIKMYAEYLGMDVGKVIEKIAPIAPEKKKNIESRLTPIKQKEYYVPGGGGIDLSHFFSKEKQRLMVKIIAGLIALFLCIRLIGCFIPKKEEKKVEVVKSTEIVSPKMIAEKRLVKDKPKAQPRVEQKVEPKVESKVEPKAEQKADAAPEEKEVAEEMKQEGNKVNLTIKALKGGWIQVKVDGVVVMESTVRTGAVESWEADREIVISGRTIHNLEFELNGKMIGTLGRQDRNARRVVITKKGLAVKG